MVDDGGLRIKAGGGWKRNDLYCLPGKAWVMGISYPETSSRVTYAPLVASSRRSCQIAAVHFNTETLRNRRFSSQGSPCLCGYNLGLRPGLPTLRFMASSRRSCQIATVLFNTETLRNRRFSSQGSPCLCGYTPELHHRLLTLRSWRLPDDFRHQLFPAKRKTVGKN